jgi:hypothetical protein
MSWQNLDTYFGLRQPVFLENLFREAEFPWTPLAGLSEAIEAFFVGQSDQGRLSAVKQKLAKPGADHWEGAYFVQSSVFLERDFVDTELRIAIAAGTFVEAGATIKDHTIIAECCEIRQGAYIRGNVFVGPNSVLGHATEIKSSILIHHVEAGHFAYIGDSIIGSFVNLGAGTKISNLEFRSLEAKQENRFPEIIAMVENRRYKTGLSKFGAVIGDGGETGCNSVLCPFVLLGPKSWVMPNICVYKGFYPKGSIIRSQPKARR